MTTAASTSNESRVAVVTGGAIGIGHGIATRLLSDGFRVVILDIHPDLEAIVSALGDGVSGLHCDIRSEKEVHRCAVRVAHDIGDVAVLVNNAGWAERAAFLDLTPSVRRRILDVNLIGTLNVTHEFLPPIVASPRGRIVMMSSDAARVGVPQESIYAAAKAGIVAFSKSLAVEVAKTDTTVNVISPGPIETPLLRELLNPEQLEHRLRQNPMRRFGTVEEIAALASFLIGADAGYISGQVVSINGALIRVD